MSGAVSFSTIPANARVPLFHIEFDNTRAGIGQANPRTLLVGESLNTQPFVPVFVPSLAWARNAFGRHSMLADMVDAALANDPLGELWAMPVEMTGGTAAAGQIAVSGTSTEAGQLSLYIAGTRVAVDVASGTAAAAVATAIAAAGTAAESDRTMPMDVGAAAGSNVPVTARHAGVLGNQLDLRINHAGPAGGEATPAGLTITLTQPTGGAGQPDLSTLVAALNDEEWDAIVVPYTDATSLSAIQTLMSDTAGRWSDASQAYGHVWSAKADTAANLVSFGGARNNQHQTVFGLYASPSPVWRQAAAYAAAAHQALKADPSRPVQALAVNGILAPLEQSRFSRANRQSLLTSGVATVVGLRDGTVQIERAVTTYQTNKYGQPDQSYLDAHRMYQLMAITRSLKTFVTQTYPRHTLADDGTRAGPGTAVVTPRLIKGALVTHYEALERAGLVDDATAFAAGLSVLRHPTDRTRVDVLYTPILTSGLSVFAVLNQFRT